MRVIKIIITLCLLYMTASGVCGQTSEGNGFVHLGVENGLSNNFVTDITQDGRGRVWLATENGLNMFDGYSFISFTNYNSSIGHNSINKIYYDKSKDRLWVGLKFGRLCSLDCSAMSFREETLSDGTALWAVVGFSKRHDGGFWILPSWGGLYRYDSSSGRIVKVKIKGMSDEQEFSCVLDDGNGMLYIGTVRQGVFVVDLKSMRAVNVRLVAADRALPSARIYAFCCDHMGNVWAGTNNGLALLNRRGAALNVFRHNPDNPFSIMSDHIYAIMETRDGYLWVGSDIGGVSIVDLRQMMIDGIAETRFRNIQAGPYNGDLSSHSVRALFQDADKNVWVGNYGGGIDFKSHRRAPFVTVHYFYPGSERHKPVWGVCSDRQGNLWAGGMNEIAMVNNNTVIKTIDIKNSLSHPYGQVTYIMQEPGGNALLLGVFDDGLLRYDPATGETGRIMLRKPNMDVYVMCRETDGSVLIGTEDGLYRYRNKHAERLYRYIEQMTEPYIYGITRDRQGKLWLGTFSGGIFVFSPSGRLLNRLQTAEGMPANGINSLFKDSKGRIWAASRAGLIEFSDTRNPRKFKVYGYKEGLTDLFVRAVAEDGAGNIWLSTNNGISMWNSRNHTFSNYGLQDGLPAGNFIESSALRTSSGNMVFGSLGGMCVFDPKAVIGRKLDMPVRIAVCKRLTEQPNGQTIETIMPLENGRLKLAHDENSFTVSFFVPDFSLSKQVEYAVKIEGLDDEWTNTMGENRITLRNMPYGHYRLKVKARMRNQQWNEAGTASLDIIISPPMWLSWPMKALYLIIIIGAGVLLLRRYIRRIKDETNRETARRRMESERELNEERLRFYTNVTHELRTPLTLILGPLEDLASDSRLPVQYHGRINSIYRSASRLLELINRLLDFRKTETNNRRLAVEYGDISSLITEIGLRYKELNRNRGVEVNVSIDTKDTMIWFDREVITTIIDNLMSNAMKYTPQGSVSLMLRSTADDVGRPCTQISVKDTGYGISQEALPHIFDRFYQAEGEHQASGTGIGLAIVKAMADLHRAVLTASSTVGRGTTFTLTLHNEDNYPEALHKETQATVKPVVVKGNKPVTHGDEKKIMLIVEDNDDIRRYIADSFGSEYTIMTAANGKDGWEKAKAGVPDIIISDIMMPVMDGLELCRLVKNDISTSHIPVILLTAKDTIADKEEGYDTGADSYIVKPFSAKLLHSRVRNLLESRRRLARIIADRSSRPQGTNVSASESSEAEAPIDGLNTMSTMFLKRFEQTVESNISNAKLDIQFMAGELGMSQSSLYRKVKGLTGLSGNELIRNIRLRHALQLMLSGEANVSTAAYQSGFNDLPYFRQCFKKEYGMTPTEYMEKH